MDRSLLERSLAENEQLITDVERRISSQRDVVERLEQARLGNHETAQRARELLSSMELNLGRRRRERKRLHVELRRAGSN